jgi:hypothetical protein
MGVLSIHDLNLVDDASVIFPHVHFNRFAGLCLLRGFNRVDHADGGFLTERPIGFEQGPGWGHRRTEYDRQSNRDDFLLHKVPPVFGCVIALTLTTEHVLAIMARRAAAVWSK